MTRFDWSRNVISVWGSCEKSLMSRRSSLRSRQVSLWARAFSTSKVWGGHEFSSQWPKWRRSVEIQAEMPSILLNIVLVVVVLTFRPPEARAQNEINQRAKRAAEAYFDKPEKLNQHGLVLVPAWDKTRWKRTVLPEDHEGDEFNVTHPKYKRLSHSVHIQSDIRYRWAGSFLPNSKAVSICRRRSLL